MTTRGHSGKFQPTNPGKYQGDATNVVFRSSWERLVMSWLDQNADIIQWAAEETIIPYRCKTDGQMHRYFVDLMIQFKSGKKFLIEIKPHSQVQPPKQSRGKRKDVFLQEAMTYAKNIAKWEAASIYAKKQDMEFWVWTEHTIQALGIKIMQRSFR